MAEKKKKKNKLGAKAIFARILVVILVTAIGGVASFFGFKTYFSDKLKKDKKAEIAKQLKEESKERVDVGMIQTGNSIVIRIYHNKNQEMIFVPLRQDMNLTLTKKGKQAVEQTLGTSVSKATVADVIKATRKNGKLLRQQVEKTLGISINSYELISHKKFVKLMNQAGDVKIEFDEAMAYTDSTDKYVTLSDLVPAPANDDDVTTLYYITDEVQQSQYINMFKEQDMDAVILNHNIDSAFITQIEQQNQHIKFKRIDADVEDALKEDVDEKELDEIKTSLTDLFRKTLNKENLEVHVEKLKDAKISSIITLSEESRRMQDMMKMYAMPGMDPNMFGAPAQVLTLNANNTLVKYLFEHGDAQNAKIICEQLYDLAMLSHTTLAPEEMTKFVQRSNEIMEMITKF